MPAFEDLGLRQELLRTLEDEDIEQPTALQEAVIPVLRRGGNLVARASTGSGKTLAYGLGVLDQLEAREPDAEEAGLRALILTPTTEAAERVALSLFPYAQAVGATLSVAGGAWGVPVTQAEVLVTPTADVMEAVRGSALKLGRLEALVVDGARAIQELGDWEIVDAVLDLLPREAQRIVVSSSFTQEIDDLIDRRVKRALRYPAEPAVPGEQPTAEGRVGYVLVPERDKLDVLARQLAQPKEGELPPVLFCRTDEGAAELAERLTTRGFLVGEADDADADAAVVAAGTTRQDLQSETGEEIGQTISFDVPADAAALSARHSGDADAVILINPRELPHLREIARQARLKARPLPLPLANGATAARLNAFRDELRRTLREEDLAAQMLVLEPLFEEFTTVEVAAAATALLRSRRPAAPAPAPTQPQPQAAAATGAVAPQQPQSGPPPATWARLYVGVGSREEVRPGDLVGAIAGEANIPGSKVGKIEVRDNFSIVEVQAEVADQVIRAVNGTTIKGRSARVDYDRGGDRGARGPARRGGPGRKPGGAPGGKRTLVRRPPREKE